MFDFVKKALMRVARIVLEKVLGNLAKQLNILDNAVRAPVKAMMQEVVGGVWIGKGANAFVDELSELFMPDVDQGTQLIESTSNNITKALSLVDGADEQSVVRVNDLRDVFSSIF